MDLKIDYIHVSKLKPYKNNARKHTRKDVECIINSIQEFGMIDPIGVWGKENLIVEGHGRLLACKKLGIDKVPCIHLDSLSDEQRKAYTLAHNDKPDVVDDATLSKMSGKTLYRTVNSNYDSINDINYTAPDIAKQVIGGKVTRVSDSGGSVNGKGIYFADNKADSHMYGDYYGDVNKTAVMKSKLNGNAKILSISKAYNGVSDEIAKKTKLGKVLNKADYNSRVSLYAMSKGYNVIQNGTYLNILNRNAITMSKDIDAMI